MESFIYIEPSEADIGPITKQIASRIKEIPPELRGPLKGIAIGHHLDDYKKSQLAGLIDELIIVDSPSEYAYNTEVISNILTDIVGEKDQGILFLGFTHQGMELGPVVGWRLGIPVMTSCVSFDWHGKEAYAQRTIFEGKLLVTCSVNMERGAVISVQKGAWKDLSSESKGDLPLTTVTWKEAWAAEKTEILAINEDVAEDKEDITKAEILVSIGRGLGGPEYLPDVKELADSLGGMISCTRPVIDLGWLPSYRQVGISGKTVAPLIYLALGISGQNNHVTGMDGSEIIIAVNKDPSAPIFNLANYGVVDDILEFVPELLRQIKDK